MTHPLHLSFCIVTSLLLLLAAGCQGGRDAKIYPAVGSIERLDPRLDKLVPRDAVLEKIGDGLMWCEGPVWFNDDGGYLLFSDIPRNRIDKWKAGEISVFLTPSGYTDAAPRGGEIGSNGLTRDAEGRLVSCEHGDRRIARLDSDHSKTTLIDRYRGKRFNSPNDLVYKSNGDLYFTDPIYGLEFHEKDPKRELDFNGVYRLTKDGKLTCIISDLSFPNGIAFSPDEKTLYVAVSDPKRAVWMAYDVQADGSVANGRVFFDATPLTQGRKGLPDGMKVDRDGNIFGAGPGGILVLSPKGEHLGTINTGQPTSNCAWGEDGSVLYITANMNLCRIKLSTKGTLPGAKKQ
jgi:gluconolactonase